MIQIIDKSVVDFNGKDLDVVKYSDGFYISLKSIESLLGCYGVYDYLQNEENLRYPGSENEDNAFASMNELAVLINHWSDDDFFSDNLYLSVFNAIQNKFS